MVKVYYYYYLIMFLKLFIIILRYFKINKYYVFIYKVLLYNSTFNVNDFYLSMNVSETTDSIFRRRVIK